MLYRSPRHVWPPATYGPLPRTRRRTGVAVLSLLSLLSLLALAGCGAPTRPAASSTTVVTPTMPPAPTETPAPEDAFRYEVPSITGLRGQVPARRPTFEVERLADVTVAHVFIQLSSPATLSNVQWDALLAQRALWTGQLFTIPDGWEVSVEFYVPPADPTAQSLGSEVGVANLHTASARQFAWASLSPQQAWSRYDGVEFNPNGL